MLMTVYFTCEHPCRECFARKERDSYYKSLFRRGYPEERKTKRIGILLPPIQNA